MNLEAPYRGGRNDCSMRKDGRCKMTGKKYPCMPSELTVGQAIAIVEECTKKFTGSTLGQVKPKRL